MARTARRRSQTDSGQRRAPQPESVAQNAVYNDKTAIPLMYITRARRDSPKRPPVPYCGKEVPLAPGSASPFPVAVSPARPLSHSCAIATASRALAVCQRNITHSNRMGLNGSNRPHTAHARMSNIGQQPVSTEVQTELGLNGVLMPRNGRPIDDSRLVDATQNTLYRSLLNFYAA